MLTLQMASSELEAGQGSPSFQAAEPHAGLAGLIPGTISRQRLMELANRLAKVQALGGEYARVDFSDDLARRAQQFGL